jgi:sec-independent protein translocase protein TatC
MADPIDKVRAAMTDRAELPGMTLMEHLDELRKCLIGAIVWLLAGVVVAGIFYKKELYFIQKPLLDSQLQMTMTHPTDAIELIIKTTILFGAIFASPGILYQVWRFISPGLYANEKKYFVPFMSATVGLFLGGAWFGYRWVLPDAIRVLVLGFGHDFNHMITIDDYTGFALAVVLGLGICFELPILMFFLALFDIADAKFFLRQWRYAVIIIFLIAAFICPLPDPVGMFLFASPMLALYLIGVAVAWFVNPARRKAKELTAA